VLSRPVVVVEEVAVECAAPADDGLWFSGLTRQAPGYRIRLGSYSAVYGGTREGCVVGVAALIAGDGVLNVRVLIVFREREHLEPGNKRVIQSCRRSSAGAGEAVVRFQSNRDQSRYSMLVVYALRRWRWVGFERRHEY